MKRRINRNVCGYENPIVVAVFVMCPNVIFVSPLIQTAHFQTANEILHASKNIATKA